MVHGTNMFSYVAIARVIQLDSSSSSLLLSNLTRDKLNAHWKPMSV